jgi:hypothetical protein
MPVTDYSILATVGTKAFNTFDILGSVTQFDYLGAQKIAAIKALRTKSAEYGYELGLADAKWTVENFDRFSTFLSNFNRFPEPGFSYTSMR